MSKCSFFLKAALSLAPGLLLSVQAAQPVELGAPEIIAHRTNPRYGNAPTAGSVNATTPISYHGGPVMASPTVYVIWYGNWDRTGTSDSPEGKQIVDDFLHAIGGSPYFNINQTYSTGNTAITGGVTYGGSAIDSGSQGTRLSDSKVWSIVQLAINSRALAKDPNGIYFVLTSSEISENSGFCTRYCGWHTHGNMSGTDIKYSFVGNAARCLNACAAQAVGPNGNAGVDAMISVIAHELEEATSDPDLNAWYDAGGAENADKCAWTFGQKLSTTSNGAYTNMTLGARSYLIQRNLYHTTSGDFCATGISSTGLTQ